MPGCGVVSCRSDLGCFSAAEDHRDESKTTPRCEAGDSATLNIVKLHLFLLSCGFGESY